MSRFGVTSEVVWGRDKLLLMVAIAMVPDSQTLFAIQTPIYTNVVQVARASHNFKEKIRNL